MEGLRQTCAEFRLDFCPQFLPVLRNKKMFYRRSMQKKKKNNPPTPVEIINKPSSPILNSRSHLVTLSACESLFTPFQIYVTSKKEKRPIALTRNPSPKWINRSNLSRQNERFALLTKLRSSQTSNENYLTAEQPTPSIS